MHISEHKSIPTSTQLTKIQKAHLRAHQNDSDKILASLEHTKSFMYRRLAKKYTCNETVGQNEKIKYKDIMKCVWGGS